MIEITLSIEFACHVSNYATKIKKCFNLTTADFFRFIISAFVLVFLLIMLVMF